MERVKWLAAGKSHSVHRKKVLQDVLNAGMFAVSSGLLLLACDQHLIGQFSCIDPIPIKVLLLLLWALDQLIIVINPRTPIRIYGFQYSPSNYNGSQVCNQSSARLLSNCRPSARACSTLPSEEEDEEENGEWTKVKNVFP